MHTFKVACNLDMVASCMRHLFAIKMTQRLNDRLRFDSYSYTNIVSCNFGMRCCNERTLLISWIAGWLPRHASGSSLAVSIISAFIFCTACRYSSRSFNFQMMTKLIQLKTIKKRWTWRRWAAWCLSNVSTSVTCASCVTFRWHLMPTDTHITDNMHLRFINR